METFDVVIVGGGVMGSAVAYHLLNLGFSGQVAVIERDPVHTKASTGLSAGGIRQQFATAVNVNLSRYSVEFYEHFSERLTVDGQCPAINFVQAGYLFLANDLNWPELRRRYELQKQLGVEVRLLTPADIAAMVPDISLEGIVGGVFGPRDGFLDPYAVMQGFEQKARALGARYLTDEVTAIRTSGGPTPRVTGVGTATHGDIAADVVVNAAGAWAGELAKTAGVELPVVPLRRQIYICKPPKPLPYQLPMVVDPSGVYFRPETGGRILIGKSREDEPAGFNFQWDRQWFFAEVWPELAQRVPLFETLGLESGWAGLYDENPQDHNAIIGEHPDLKGFYLINGFSGHGMMQGPGAGLALAELILYGEYRTIDVSALSPARFRAGNLVREDAVI